MHFLCHNVINLLLCDNAFFYQRTFKRPVGGYAAALIDQAGLKGYTVGGAQVSEKHAGFVVNRGGATFDDVLRLMDDVRSAVLRTSGVELEPEVKIIRG